MVAASELPINTSASATQMAETIFGDNVQVVGASYTGSNYSSGIYTDGDSTAPGVTPGDTGVILSTGRARDFTNSSGQSNHSNSTTTNTRGPNNDSDFNALAGTHTYDASFIEVDFIPTDGLMSIQFSFASEEFPEYVGTLFNDTIGVWINGAPVDIAVGTGTQNVGNVSPINNTNLYNDNTSDQYNTEMDGFTATLTLKFNVIPGQVNSIKIGIADVADSSYDSNLLIAGNSIQGGVIANDDSLTLGLNGSKTVDLLANDTGPGNSSLFITHINGVAVSAGDTITLATGQQITLNADGTVTILGDGDTESFNFSYTMASGGGNSSQSDTGFVIVDQVPCFVAGTLIETENGAVAVESLQPGDMVRTRDHGAQPLRWIGRRVVPAEGDFAPIRIAADTFGNHDTILVSPQHRILIRDALAELLFEAAEVLVAAKHLVNDGSVRVAEGGDVEYVHILFDSHEVVYSAGLATESFLPGPQTTATFEEEMLREICTLFPELDPRTGSGYSPAARRVLKGYEARALLGFERAA